MHFPDTADKKKEDVKEAGELKPENVNKGKGTDGAKPENTEGADKTGGNNRYIFQYFIQIYISLLT